MIGGWFDRAAGKAKRPASSNASGSERREAPREAAKGAGVQLEWRGADGHWRIEPVESCDASTSGLGVLSESGFQPGQTIYVLRDGVRAMQANVCHVKPVGDSYHIGVRLIPNERRRIERTPASGEAVVRWTRQDGESIRLAARICNVSDGGLQIETESGFDEGAVLKLTGSEVECLASVRYCRPRGDAFAVGLQIIGEPSLTPGVDPTG